MDPLFWKRFSPLYTDFYQLAMGEGPEKTEQIFRELKFAGLTVIDSQDLRGPA